MTELETIHKFASEQAIDDSIGLMQERLDMAIGFAQRVGEMVNLKEEQYALEQKKAMDKFAYNEEETETTRKTRIVGETAGVKRELQDLKLLYRTLIKRQMSLMQAIRTRREEPR